MSQMEIGAALGVFALLLVYSVASITCMSHQIRNLEDRVREVERDLLDLMDEEDA